jgi:ketosteroid isomerase-like protein
MHSLTSSITSNEEGLRAAEAARLHAMQTNDGAALGALLCETLIYQHSSGARDTRESYMSRMASGSLHYDKVDFLQPEFQMIGDARVGLVHARMLATVVRDGTAREIANTYLAVWEHQATGWKLVALQGTTVVAPNP